MEGQLPLDLGHRPALGRADFLVAPSNAEAVAWLDRWPLWPAPALALYGPKGSGKTHLAHVFAARAGARFIDPATLATERVPTLLGEARAAIVDDAAAAAAEPLLHLYNVLAEQQGHLLLVAREPPAHWAIALPDLRSRLLACPAVALSPPDEALIGALLVKLFADRQLVVGDDIVTYLTLRLERSFDAVLQAVATLDRAALAERRRITVPLARRVLGFD
ncbi:MAG TPA: DNA replication protein [Stellaceae bacterium]|jgi:DnaA regulatory inactivator Hda|nr:DNA replication protein [Stellaceae bacterium]